MIRRLVSGALLILVTSVRVFAVDGASEGLRPVEVSIAKAEVAAQQSIGGGGCTSNCTFTGSSTLSNNGIGAVSTDGFVLTNTTAAGAGAQQWPPRLKWCGQGWQTSTPASETVCWIAEAQTVQHPSHPSADWVLSYSINGGAYVKGIDIDNSSGNATNLNVANGAGVTAITLNGSNGSITSASLTTTGMVIPASGAVAWGTGLGAITHILGPTDQDLLITSGANTGMQLRMGSTIAAAVLQTVNGAKVVASATNLQLGAARNGSTVNTVEVAGSVMRFINADTPTVSTCGTGTVTTGSTDNAGEVTATGAATCTVNFTVSGTSGFQTVAFCTVTDETTVAALRISAISTTAFTVTGLTSGDKFMYHCFGK